MHNLGKKFTIFFLMMFIVSLVSLPADAAVPADPNHCETVSNIYNPYAGCAVKRLNAICTDAFVATGNELRIVGGMATCFTNLITKVAIGDGGPPGSVGEGSLQKMTRIMQNTIATMLTLYVIFFGAKMALGVTEGAAQKGKGELVIGGIKIGFIVFLFFNFGVIELWQITLSVYGDLVGIVLEVASLEGCTAASVSVPGLVDSSGEIGRVWVAMDCVLSQLLGWNQDGSELSKVPALFSFLSTFFTQGLKNGIIVIVVAFAVWNMLVGFFRVVFVYIFSLIGLLIVFSLAPIFIPLVLFEKTKSYFESWWKIVVSMIVQPVILFAFLGFSLTMFNQIMIGTPGHDPSNPDGLLDVLKKVSPQGVVAETTRNGPVVNVIQAFQNLSGTDQKITDLSRELTVSLLKVMVVSYIMITFSTFVEDIAAELGGSKLIPKLSQFMPRGLGI